MTVKFKEDGLNVYREDGRERNLMDPFMDWPFKYLFAREENKENLIWFLKFLILSAKTKMVIGFGYKEGIFYMRNEF